MRRILVRVLVPAAVLAVLVYGGRQVLRGGLDLSYHRYINLTLESARSDNLLIGEYRAICTEGAIASAYVTQPAKKSIGYLLVGMRIILPDAVTVTVDVEKPRRGIPTLVFDEGVSVSLGDSARNSVTPFDTVTHDFYSAYRSTIPARFTLADADGAHLCAFTFDEATRQDVPRRTRWTW